MIINPDIASRIKILLIKAFVLSGYILHVLVGRLFGILLFSLLLYFSAPLIGLAQPYSAHELLLWIDQLPDNYKTTTFGSLLTIVGFLIAFRVGSAQQKQQFISQMKIDVASDVEEFFNEASRKATDIEVYAKYLLEIASIIEEGKDHDSIEFHMYNIANETSKFIQAREILKYKSVEVHRFKGKYSIILASSWGVISQLDKAIQAFNNITDAMWLPSPLINPNTPNKEGVFMRQISIEKCQTYIDTYKDNYLIMNSTTGGLRGRLLAPITGMNFSFILSLLKLKIEKKNG